jgi:uncharacterized protein
MSSATHHLAVASAGVGIGLRHPHFDAFLATRPGVDFVEVHAENFFAPGGAALALLTQVRQDHAVSLHGVGLSLGSAVGLDIQHLSQLAHLAERIEPCLVSEHASFARAPRSPGGPLMHANDLLPLAFTQASLDILCSNVSQAQDRLRRVLLIENLSAYVAWLGADMSEPEFFNQLTRRTGCRLLLDVNNLVVNALNAGDADADAVRSACAWMDAIDVASVGEIHLAGYRELDDVVIDDHGSAVRPGVWQVFRHAAQRFGPVPALVEWDTDIPPLSALLQEAHTAAQVWHELRPH